MDTKHGQSVSASQFHEPFRDFTHDAWGLGIEHSAFMARFKRENGREPRVLHIGNIANNAFKNAYVLRKHGIECDVLCHNYYHVMGCPEWELAEFATDDFNFNAPHWSNVDLGNYDRPDWFAQGRILTCIDYLIALREGSPKSKELWNVMMLERDSAGQEFPGSSQPVSHDYAGVRASSEHLSALYEVTFPERIKMLDADAISLNYGYYLNEKERFKKLFSYYDLVIGYAIDGIFPLIAKKFPYACFEHGTIRAMPFEDTITGQICALSYACASDVLISNCDNIISARRLKLRSFRFLPHAMIEDFRIDLSAADLRADIYLRHDADFIIFHPSRQHWSDTIDLNWEKGNDRLIRAFARFLAHERPRALLIMVAWGEKLDASRQLIEQLGISKRVVWLDPKPMRVVGRYVAAADVLADQFVIGAWGAIMPHGMMLGTPTMLYLNETLHEWCFPEMPPVLNAGNDDEIHAALVKATEPAYREQIRSSGAAWYDRYHSETVVAGRLMDSIWSTLTDHGQARARQQNNQIYAGILAGQRHSNQVSSDIAAKQQLITADIVASQQIVIAASLVPMNARIQAIQQDVAFLKSSLERPRFSTRVKTAALGLQQRHPILGGAAFQILRFPWKVAKWIKWRIIKGLF